MGSKLIVPDPVIDQAVASSILPTPPPRISPTLATGSSTGSPLASIGIWSTTSSIQSYSPTSLTAPQAPSFLLISDDNIHDCSGTRSTLPAEALLFCRSTDERKSPKSSCPTLRSPFRFTSSLSSTFQTSDTKPFGRTNSRVRPPAPVCDSSEYSTPSELCRLQSSVSVRL